MKWNDNEMRLPQATTVSCRTSCADDSDIESDWFSNSLSPLIIGLGEDEERLPLATTISSSSSSSSSDDSEDETLSRIVRRNGTPAGGSPRLNRDGSNGTDSPRRKEQQYDSLFLESLPEVSITKLIKMWVFV